METTVTPPRKLLAALAAPAMSHAPARADGPYRNTDNKNPQDPAEGSYPAPCHKPSRAETRLLNNPAFEFQYRLRTYQYVPKAPFHP